jgi:hypothetical protein
MIKSITKLFALFMLVLALFSFVKVENWFLFTSDQFACQVEFPKEPKAQTQIINTELGELEMNLFIYDASNSEKDDNLVYLLSITEYPDTLINSKQTEIQDTFFRASIDGAVNNVGGELLSEKEITIDKYPGREIKIDFQNGRAIIIMRLYLVESKIYMLQTITETEKASNSSISRFMDSFELTNASEK